MKHLDVLYDDRRGGDDLLAEPATTAALAIPGIDSTALLEPAASPA
jgi:hypothetical protein